MQKCVQHEFKNLIKELNNWKNGKHTINNPTSLSEGGFWYEKRI